MKSGQGGIAKKSRSRPRPSAAAATDVVNYAIYWEENFYE
jgi:hypothetical protein